jgi:hypothetical protein
VERDCDVGAQVQSESGQRCRAVREESFAAGLVDWRLAGVHHKGSESLQTGGNGGRQARWARADNDDLRPEIHKASPFEVL